MKGKKYGKRSKMIELRRGNSREGKRRESSKDTRVRIEKCREGSKVKGSEGNVSDF